MVHTKKSASVKNSSYALHPDQIAFMLDALEQRDNTELLHYVNAMHAADITEFLNIITQEQRKNFLEIIRHNFDPEILVDLDPDVKDDVLILLGTAHSAEAISQLEHDDALQVIEDLEPEEQEEILDAICQERRDGLEEGLAYPDDSAGRMINTRYVAVSEQWDVGQVIDYLRLSEELPDVFYSIFVVDGQNRPLGAVLLSRVIRNKRTVKIKTLMEDKIYTINDTMDQEEVAYIFRKYALASAPVIDLEGKIVGVITVDDVVDVIDEEAEEDILRMAGVQETDISAAFLQTAWHRFPWLFVNLLTAIAASAVISYFEASIQQLVALAVLMPIVASMAGNAGMQTLTIAVRSLATKELTSTNARRVVGKEVLASVVNGGIFAFIVGGTAYMVYGDGYLSLVFAISIVAALLLASLAGALIPLVMVRFGADPAVASTVFLTTVTDISAFFIFLGLASFWLL